MISQNVGVFVEVLVSPGIHKFSVKMRKCKKFTIKTKIGSGENSLTMTI